MDPEKRNQWDGVKKEVLRMHPSLQDDSRVWRVGENFFADLAVTVGADNQRD